MLLVLQDRQDFEIHCLPASDVVLSSNSKGVPSVEICDDDRVSLRSLCCWERSFLFIKLMIVWWRRLWCENDINTTSLSLLKLFHKSNVPLLGGHVHLSRQSSQPFLFSHYLPSLWIVFSWLLQHSPRVDIVGSLLLLDTIAEKNTSDGAWGQSILWILVLAIGLVLRLLQWRGCQRLTAILHVVGRGVPMWLMMGTRTTDILRLWIDWTIGHRF